MWILFGCAAVCFGICLPLFRHFKASRPFLGACFKTLGTLCALVPALTAALKLNSDAWFFVAAICLHAAGDYLLEFWFELGMGAFLLGHLCYIIAFLRLFSVGLPHLVLSVCFLAFLAVILYRSKERIGKNLYAFSVYGTVLSLMAACGISGGISAFSVQGALIAIGGSLFIFSDYLLFQRLLFPSGRNLNLAIMITYYLAQLLLGSSCLF